MMFVVLPALGALLVVVGLSGLEGGMSPEASREGVGVCAPRVRVDRGHASRGNPTRARE